MAPSALYLNDSHEAPMPRHGTECAALPNVKVIMITGGAGFIGSWMVRTLMSTYQSSYHIVCFDTFEACASINNIKAVEDNPKFSLFRGDLRNIDDVSTCFLKYNVDAVIHFAAFSHVDTSFSTPLDFTMANVVGTHNLLEVSRLHEVKRFVHISTDEVYGEILPGGRDHIESDPLHPTNPYSASKAGAEMMVSAYVKSFNIPAIIVRSNNVYGPHQFPEKLIPKFIMLMLKNKKVPLYGHGLYTRRYVYALDAVNAVNIIFHRGQVGETYNIGSYDEVSNREICHMLVSLINPASSDGNALGIEALIEPTQDRPYHDRRYGVDFSKLMKLGWKQKVDLIQGLHMSVAWYKEHGTGWWDTASSNGSVGSKMENSVILDRRLFTSLDGSSQAQVGEVTV